MTDTKTDVKSVSAIIVNYNSASHVARCIDSLRSQEGIALEILVVDNSSNEAEASLLSDLEKKGVLLIRNPENVGFGRANNIAGAKAKGALLLIINPDAEFCGRHDLFNLCAWMEAHPEAALVGPEIYEPEKDKYVRPKLRYPASEGLKFTPGLEALPGNIAWLLGACLLIRKTTFDALGGFDQDYFLYGEDVDLCIRARKAGFLVGYCEDSHVMHIGGASAATLPSLDKFLLKKRGYFLFCRKHYHPKDVRRIAQTMAISSRLKLAISTIKDCLGLGVSAKSSGERLKWRAELEVSIENLKPNLPK